MYKVLINVNARVITINYVLDNLADSVIRDNPLSVKLISYVELALRNLSNKLKRGWCQLISP